MCCQRILTYASIFLMLLRGLLNFLNPDLTPLCSIANDRTLSWALVPEGGIAAAKILLSILETFQKGWGTIFPFFYRYSKRAAFWVNQRTFHFLLGELNFDLCESGLQRLTKVDLSNRASSNINLQNWNSFLRCIRFFLMPTIKLIENYIAVATTLI